MSNLKSLEEEFRAEMSKNTMIRVKQGLSRDQTQEGSLEATPVKKALFPKKSISKSNKDSFTSNNGKGGYKSDRVAF